MRVMRPLTVWVIVAASSSVAHAQQLAEVCHATSSYDLTIEAHQLVFDRTAPAPHRIAMHDGNLRVDGQPVSLNDEDQDRIDLFERNLRALAPRVKAVAEQGVDLAAQTVHDQAGALNLSTDTRSELDRRLSTHAAELKQRIVASQSTHDWHGDAANEYANQVVEDIAPLLAADIGQQAMNAALNGDLQAAANLRDHAGGLATQLQPRIERRLQSLRPQIQALCPDIRRLAELQDGVHDNAGQPLNLLHVGQ
jgi:hypothetical protein